jgi:hypothetical protein
MNTVTIEIDSKWQRLVRSRLYFAIAALQGVAITFVPLFLYWCGREPVLNKYAWLIVPACWVVIYGIGLFYFRLGGAVIKELLEK